MAQRVERHRVNLLGRIIPDSDARRVFQNPADIIQLELLLELQVHRLGMTSDDRDTRGSGRNAYRIITQNLMSLIHHLHLLLGVAVLGKIINMRNYVLVDRIRELSCIFAPLGTATLRLHLRHCLVSGAGHALICRNHHPLDAVGLVQRSQRQKHLDRRAIRIGNDIVVLGEHIRVHFRNHEFLVRIHTPA